MNQARGAAASTNQHIRLFSFFAFVSHLFIYLFGLRIAAKVCFVGTINRYIRLIKYTAGTKYRMAAPLWSRLPALSSTA